MKYIDENLTEFKGTFLKISEVEVLKRIEDILKKDLTIVDEIEVKTQNSFSHYNNHITGLGLYNQGIESLPESIGDLSKLKVLYLKKNNLNKLPKSFIDLNSLKRLNLSYNSLNVLPESFGKLKTLQWFWISNNRLAKLPSSFKDLINLRDLSLADNNLESIPENFINLESLETLRIEGNSVSLTPEEIKGKIDRENKKKSEIKKDRVIQKRKGILKKIKEKLDFLTEEQLEIIRSIISYKRDPKIAETAKTRANGICECCEKHSTFITAAGKEYLEGHHIEQLSEGGLDTIENVGAICETCHRKIHYGPNETKIKLKAKLKKKIENKSLEF